VQKVTIRQSGAVNRVTAELIDNVIYVKGDAHHSRLLEPLHDNRNAAFESMVLHQGTSAEYGEVAQGMTIASGMSEVAFQKVVTSHGTKTIDGTKVTVLQAPRCQSLVPRTAMNDGRQYIGEAAAVKVIQTFKGQTATFTFSKWNENFSLSAPDAKFQLT